jgi:hypothetical protein
MELLGIPFLQESFRKGGDCVNAHPASVSAHFVLSVASELLPISFFQLLTSPPATPPLASLSRQGLYSPTRTGGRANDHLPAPWSFCQHSA